MPGRLTDLFLPALATAARETFATSPDLERALTAAVERARATWPELDVPEQAFLPFVARRVPEDAAPGTVLERLNLPDLYLACGCAHGDPAAVSAFSTTHFPQIERAVAGLEVSKSVIEDVRQGIFEKLFVGDGEREPKICHYGGEGDLGTWVRVVAVRQAIDIIRKSGRELPTADDRLPDLVTQTEDPELRFLKERYRVEFKEVFQEALSALSSRERNVLRYQLVGHLTIEQIAALYQVNRSTVVRWLQKVRERLLKDTRRELSRRLKLDRAEFDSLMRLISSQLHVSIKRVLGEED